MRFYVPKTLASDFDDFLQTDVCFDIKITHDICAETVEWINERAEISSKKIESNSQTTDDTFYIYLSKNSQIQKGDMISWKNRLYLDILENQLIHPNCIEKQMVMCNANLTIKRYSKGVLDSEGNYTTPPGWNDLVSSIRVVLTTDGRYNYTVSANQPGMLPSDHVTVYLQANSKTLTIKNDDMFYWFGDAYAVRSCNYNQMDYDGANGVIELDCEKTVNINGIAV